MGCRQAIVTEPKSKSTTVRWEEQVEKALDRPVAERGFQTAEMILTFQEEMNQEERNRGKQRSNRIDTNLLSAVSPQAKVINGGCHRRSGRSGLKHKGAVRTPGVSVLSGLEFPHPGASSRLRARPVIREQRAAQRLRVDAQGSGLAPKRSVPGARKKRVRWRRGCAWTHRAQASPPGGAPPALAEQGRSASDGAAQ